MTKAIILNDIHFGVRNSNPHLLKDAEKVFIDVSKHLEEGDEIFILGDTFDNRNTISVEAMNSANRSFELLGDYKVTMIPGNHDIKYVNNLRPNSIDPLLDNFDNIDILYEPTEYQFGNNTILFVPWIIPSATVEWSRIIRDSKCDICMGHFDIIGFQFNSKTMNDKIGFKKSTFEHFDKVLSGHYHFADEKGNIKYLGTQYQMTWDDYRIQKKFHILHDDGKLEEVDSGRELFRIVNINDEIDDSLERCYVKLTCDSSHSNTLIKEKVDEILEKNAIKVDVSQKFDTNNELGAQEISQSIANTTDIKELVKTITSKMNDNSSVQNYVSAIIDEAYDIMGE